MIIAAFCGTGKSVFAAKNPEKVIDFVCMPYKYFLDSKGEDGEFCKANPKNVMRPDWPFNYLNAIKDTDSKGKLILIPSESQVLELLRAENIPYVLVYPQREAKDIYHKRFIDRGNSDDFINIFIGNWDYFLDVLEKDPAEHIVLQPHQFLSDAIDVTQFIEEHSDINSQRWKSDYSSSDAYLLA